MLNILEHKKISLHQMKRYETLFFPQSCNLIAFCRRPDFPISDHGHVTAGRVPVLVNFRQ